MPIVAPLLLFFCSAPTLFTRGYSLSFLAASLWLCLLWMPRQSPLPRSRWVLVFPLAFLLYGIFSVAGSKSPLVSLLGDTPHFLSLSDWIFFLLLVYALALSFPREKISFVFRALGLLAAALLFIQMLYSRFPLPFGSPYLLLYFALALTPFLFPLNLLSLLILLTLFFQVFRLLTLGLLLFFLLSLLLAKVPRMAPLIWLTLFLLLFLPQAPLFFPYAAIFKTFSLSFFGFHFIAPTLFFPAGAFPTAIALGAGGAFLLLVFFSLPLTLFRGEWSSPILLFSVLFFFGRWSPLFFPYLALLLSAAYAPFLSPAHPQQRASNSFLPVRTTRTQTGRTALPQYGLLFLSLLYFLKSSFFFAADLQAHRALALAHRHGLTDVAVTKRLKHAWHLYPLLTPVQTTLASAYALSQREAEAISLYEQLIARFPRPGLYWDLAQALSRAGRYREARTSARQALLFPYFQLRRGDSEFWTFIGDTFFAEGDYSKALRAYREAAAWERTPGIALLKEGISALRLKKSHQALQIFEYLAVNGKDPNLQAGSWMNAGILYLNAKQFQKAKKAFQKGYDLATSFELKENLERYLLYTSGL